MTSRSLPQDIVTQEMQWCVTAVLCIALAVSTVAKAPPKPADTAAPDAVMVEVRWPDSSPADVDLWVQAPGDVPVGYSNKGGAIFNLLRDDLGRQGDPTRMNYETSYSRGLPPGEYTVNLHQYRGVGPTTAMVVVSVKPDPDAGARQILAQSATLRGQGEELTVFRFKLDAAGALVGGSVHAAPKGLRVPK
jgi:hypothetical protein